MFWLGSRIMFRYYLEYRLKFCKNETKNYSSSNKIVFSISAKSLVGPDISAQPGAQVLLIVLLFH